MVALFPAAVTADHADRIGLNRGVVAHREGLRGAGIDGEPAVVQAECRVIADRKSIVAGRAQDRDAIRSGRDERGRRAGPNQGARWSYKPDQAGPKSSLDADGHGGHPARGQIRDPGDDGRETHCNEIRGNAAKSVEARVDTRSPAIGGGTGEGRRTASRSEGARGRRVGAAEDTQDGRLRSRIRRRPSHLLLRVHLRSVQRQAKCPNQENAHPHNQEQNRLPALTPGMEGVGIQ